MRAPSLIIPNARTPLGGHRVVVGLGANLGAREATMARALGAFDSIAQVLASSSFYETAPIGPIEQPTFLNAAALLLTGATPLLLLRHLLAVELELGRVRTERWGPRTIDLDILWIDGVIVDDPKLTVPHPELHRRAFALAPLLELVPEAIDPRTSRTFEPVIDQDVRRRPDRLASA